MLKNLQTKIFLIFIIVGILLITALGYIYIYNLQDLSTGITNVENINEIQEIISVKNEQIILASAITIIIFVMISVLVSVFILQMIIKPITELIKNAGKIAAGEEINNQMLNYETGDAEVDDLLKAFQTMTTELKENLNETTRQKKQIETILLHMTDGILAFNLDGKIIHQNPAATTLLNLKQEDDSFEAICKKLKVDINLEKIIYLENWTSSEQKIEIEDKYMNLFFAPFKNENDRPAGVIVVIQDITEHVKLDNMQKEFVADVSHELKTPITSIMGYADTLLEGEYDKETQDKFLNVIANEGRRMARLVTDLLALSRYDMNKAKCKKTDFDLGELVKQCLENLKIEIEKKNHKVECFVTASVPLVTADRDGIERVVLNILSNSIKYTKNGGHIKIYVGFVYNDAYIKIIDDGIGIPEADLSRIFERFYRVDKARTREMGGTGLGLSIAKEILDQNDARIDIKSEVEKGTEVIIRIPTKIVESTERRVNE